MSISHALKGFSFPTVLLIFATLVSVEAFAACPREDVSFYLQQGFTHEQIIKLCSEPSPLEQKTTIPTNTPPAQKTLSPHSQQRTKPLVASPAIQHETSGIYGNSDAIFLATAIEAYDVEVTENTIMFTRKECFTYGQEDWNEFKNSACPTVKYTIVRGELKILERDNGFFGLGATALYISGNIKADILDLGKFKQSHQEEINQTIQQNTEKLKIDVRSGMPQNKVEAILLKLAG
jgi:hypothetical protein